MDENTGRDSKGLVPVPLIRERDMVKIEQLGQSQAATKVSMEIVRSDAQLFVAVKRIVPDKVLIEDIPILPLFPVPSVPPTRPSLLIGRTCCTAHHRVRRSSPEPIRLPDHT